MSSIVKMLKKIIQENKNLKLLLIQIVILIILVIIFAFVESPFVNLVPRCYWKEQYGFYCPSCGSTRCVISLVNGDFISAFTYNPFTFCLIIYLLLLNFLYIINTIFKKSYLNFFYPKWWYIIVYFLLWFIYTITINL